ncbi:MAG: amino acid--tRNA ligase-related protein, partial [Oscillospiraceae bacterium]
MKRTEITKLYAEEQLTEGMSVTVCGWVKTSRESKNLGFIEINDGSCFKNLQVIVEADKLVNFKEIANAGVGSAIAVNGKIKLTPGAKQSFEVNADSVSIEGVCPSDYPLQKKRHSLEFLRTLPHLRARTNTYSAVFRVRSEAAFALHKFFNENGFVYVHTPLITGSDCEGAGEMFRVTTLDPINPPLTESGKVDFSQDFFGRETNLTVSGQLEG